jgi:uncharacterized protein (DUF1697 family)
MALVVLLRGVNVGGHKTFRPKRLAERLRDLDVVNIGAAGTFVVRRRGRFILGMYRRHMKTIRYLGTTDDAFDVPVTTRNWSTVAAIAEALCGGATSNRRARA